MGRRHRAREFAVQILFQIDVTGDGPDEVLPDFWARNSPPPGTTEFAEHLVRGVTQHRALLDEVLQTSSEHWRIERMAIVDRNVLRLATLELLDSGEVPPAVIIDEAIEVAKRFGNADSGPFVNGVLDAVRVRLDADELKEPSQQISKTRIG